MCHLVTDQTVRNLTRQQKVPFVEGTFDPAEKLMMQRNRNKTKQTLRVDHCNYAVEVRMEGGGGGTSGTSRDLPIFVQFHEKFVQLVKMKKKKNCKKMAYLEKKM